MTGISDIKHFGFLFFENEDGNNAGSTAVVPIDAAECPFIFSVLKPMACELTDYFGVSDPSAPNYTAVVDGSTHNLTADPTCPTGYTDKTIVDLLATKGFNAKNYCENLPSSPCTACDAPPYKVHHNFFSYFKNACSLSVPFGQLSTDVSAGKLPTVFYISPNIYDDCHTLQSGSNNRYTQGDNWLKNTLYPVLKSHLATDTVLFLTFDTGVNSTNANSCGSTSGAKVTTFVIGPASIVKQGTQDSSGPYNHFSALAMIEKIFGLGNLGNCDAGASTFDGAFQSGSGCPSGDVPENPDGSCPSGYEPDTAFPGCCKPVSGVCPPGDVPANPDGSCPSGYEPDSSSPGCCKPIPSPGGVQLGGEMVVVAAASVAAIIMGALVFLT